METCTNCGATLRPGAKFCTTCGTRLNEMPAANSGWGTPRSVPEPVDQETAVLPVVQPAPEQPVSWGRSDQQAADRWGSAYAAPKPVGADDPASRFISALDADVKPAPTTPTTTPDPLANWGAPPPSAFTPPPPSTGASASGSVVAV